ncbi:FAD-binding protein [Cereibacter sp. SYSU M97828]|nr:FAD-binding protein [Cereibacter flavus]
MTEDDLAEAIATAHDTRTAILIEGGGTRSHGTATLSTRAHSGIVTYEPGALTLIARAGTPVEEIEAALASEGQMLAFEPMDHRRVLGTNGTPTIGGVVAANVSGPRRVLAGACRDHLLGLRFIDGQGRILKNGGRVMKNVTGLDLGKLLCGSHGTLGVITEVALKTLPRPETVTTLAFQTTAAQAVDLFCTALGTPFEVSGAAWLDGAAYLRIEGLEAQVAYRAKRLSALLPGAEPAAPDWAAIRDAASFTGPLWRILCKPTDAPAICARLGGRVALDWAGGLIWYQGDADVRAIAPNSMQIGGPLPTAPGTETLVRNLRRQFDPAGILNPGLMGA